ncbi:MAG: hypothetical protein KF916_03095 [Microbacteriaceae bacterium]|nr:hypothetical protein [Microbacteriaceae bacterium]
MSTKNHIDSIPFVAHFYSPPGWPRPSRRWIIENQGWRPPANWRPHPSLPKAPVGWVFWRTEGPDADRYFVSVMSPLRLKWALWSVVSIFVGMPVMAFSTPSLFAGLLGFGLMIAWLLACWLLYWRDVAKHKLAIFEDFTAKVRKYRLAVLQQEYHAYSQRFGRG